MQSNDDLEQLKKLVLEDGWDDESKEAVKELEERLQTVAIQEKLAENAAIKPFIDYLTDEVERCEMLLKKDKSLTDRQRDELFARIEIASNFTSVFTGSARQS